MRGTAHHLAGNLVTSSTSWSLRAVALVAACFVLSTAAFDFFGHGLVIPSPQSSRATYEVHHFTLRNIFHHGTRRYPGLHRRLDVSASTLLVDDESNPDAMEPLFTSPLQVGSAPLQIQRLANRSHERMEELMQAGRNRGSPVELPAALWTVDTIPGPNVTDKDSLLTLAKMCLNAYVSDPGDAEWEPVKGGFNYTDNFGWEKDGLRGHIFADETNGTVAIAFKGTSPPSWSGETTAHDKENDNLFFSCCCGQGGYLTWKNVCDCQTSTYTCNSTCVVEALQKKDRYYAAAQEIYRNVTELYPNADIWLTGHSLGGALASMVGATYGLPVVSFEAPPEALPSFRLGLPTPPKYRIGNASWKASTGGYHFGHTADPVFTGTCSGAVDSCSLGGYAMQSICHTGHRCVYDTVKDLGWHNYIGNHRINVVVHQVVEEYDTVPSCAVDEECTDCYNWKFYEGDPSSITSTMTSTTTSYSRTRSETCKTPGWWGCLDESTTTTTTTPSPSITTTTSTATSTICNHPGFFGCKDPTTTTSTTTITSTASVCHTPGFFWCRDKTSSSPSKTAAPGPTRSHPQPPPTSSCHTPGWFRCRDETTTSKSHKTTSASPSTTTTSLRTTTSTCQTPGFFWGCRDRFVGYDFIDDDELHAQDL